jgi:hypothetical protein
LLFCISHTFGKFFSQISYEPLLWQWTIVEFNLGLGGSWWSPLVPWWLGYMYPGIPIQLKLNRNTEVTSPMKNGSLKTCHSMTLKSLGLCWDSSQPSATDAPYMDSAGSCGSGFLQPVSVAKFSLVCGPIWASRLSRF